MEITLTPDGERKARDIIAMIESVRAEHHACTAREVSRLLRLTHTVLVGRLVRMRELGLVEWTDMTGSLRVTNEGRAWANPVEERVVTVNLGAPKKAAAKKAAPRTRKNP